ncbi:MAG: type III pantothenate kinase [Dehalococcoidia bacterium]|nr:type III pantothenate kinase [Dehalococcoidia bacterium]
MTDVVREYFKVEPRLVGHGLRTGVRILDENPKGLGFRPCIVDAVAAIHLYGAPVIVVDFGTGTVFDAINTNGDYLGGAIAPGIGIASEALFSRGAMLSRVALETPPSAIGRNTVNAMQSGILYGYAGLVDGIVKRFKQELESDDIQVVAATGGWANQIAPLTETIGIVLPGAHPHRAPHDLTSSTVASDSDFSVLSGAAPTPTPGPPAPGGAPHRARRYREHRRLQGGRPSV